MKQLSYEDQKTLLELSINVSQNGADSPPAVKKLQMFCMEKLGLEGCRELYDAWLEDLKEERNRSGH